MKLALITGGTGFIGSWLCRELISNDWKVRVLVRKTSKKDKLENLPIEYFEGDVTDYQSLLTASQNVDVIFHCAALYREAKFPDKMYWEVNLEGTRNVLLAGQANQVKKVIHCSTTGVTGHIANPPADESQPYSPLDVYQESKTEAEKLVLEWARSGKINACVIRPTMVWGPEDTRLFKLFKGIFNRRLPIIGTGKTLCHWVLVTDLVRAFRFAAERDQTNGELYIVGGDHPVSLEYTMQIIADTYKTKLWPFKLPVWPFQFFGAICEMICKPFGIEPPLHRRRADFFIKNRAFNCQKAAKDLDYTPSHSVEEEVKLVAKWYINNNWLSTNASK